MESASSSQKPDCSANTKANTTITSSKPNKNYKFKCNFYSCQQKFDTNLKLQRHKYRHKTKAKSQMERMNEVLCTALPNYNWLGEKIRALQQQQSVSANSISKTINHNTPTQDIDTSQPIEITVSYKGKLLFSITTTYKIHKGAKLMGAVGALAPHCEFEG